MVDVPPHPVHRTGDTRTHGTDTFLKGERSGTTTRRTFVGRGTNDVRDQGQGCRRDGGPEVKGGDDWSLSHRPENGVRSRLPREETGSGLVSRGGTGTPSSLRRV